MRLLLFIGFILQLALGCPCASAEAAPNHELLPEAAIYFTNGTATDIESAAVSLQLLRGALGDACNGRLLHYGLAYNAPHALSAALTQAVAKAKIQWNSSVMGWLTELNPGPGWLMAWYTNFLLQREPIAASDLDRHIGMYVDAIRRQQRVLVVAHAQGNFYANEAKLLLAQHLSPSEMNLFGVFGLATPTGHVADSHSGYYTHHRDLMRDMPGALPYNWTLRHAGGRVADDIPRIKAHFFETYLSPEFDLRSHVLSGIEQQLLLLHDSVPHEPGRPAWQACLIDAHE